MASSNRHWPSQFKSKPQHHLWQQHEHNRTLHDSAGSEERTKDLKPRWNPKPEQIRILEAIFNSGMVSPPREEIRRIRVQLQEYGQVGDANVFYWFQNKKSRSKLKQQRNTKSHTHAFTTVAPLSSSSSSSDISSQNATTNNKMAPFPINIMTDGGSLNSPTASVKQHNFHPSPGELLTQPFFFPVLSGGNHASSFTQGFSFTEISSSNNMVHQQTQMSDDDQTARNHSNLLLSDLMMNDMNYKNPEEEKNKPLQPKQLNNYCATPTMAPNTVFLPLNTLDYAVNNVQGKSTVMINDVRFEVPSGPLNVKETFGDDAVLIHSSGQPVVTNKWGVTLQPLHHGAFYYLI